MDKKYLVLNIEQDYRTDLENLPWDTPLIEWNDKQESDFDKTVKLIESEEKKLIQKNFKNEPK